MGPASQQAALAGGSSRDVSAQVILGMPCVPGTRLTSTLRPHPDPSRDGHGEQLQTGSEFPVLGGHGQDRATQGPTLQSVLAQ